MWLVVLAMAVELNWNTVLTCFWFLTPVEIKCDQNFFKSKFLAPQTLNKPIKYTFYLIQLFQRLILCAIKVLTWKATEQGLLRLLNSASSGDTLNMVCEYLGFKRILLKRINNNKRAFSFFFFTSFSHLFFFYCIGSLYCCQQTSFAFLPSFLPFFFKKKESMQIVNALCPKCNPNKRLITMCCQDWIISKRPIKFI